MSGESKLSFIITFQMQLQLFGLVQILQASHQFLLIGGGEFVHSCRKEVHDQEQIWASSSGKEEQLSDSTMNTLLFGFGD
jgi:hypothetical protein